MVPAGGDDGLMVGNVDRQQFGDFADAGVTRRRIEAAEQWACREFCRKGMFAAAGTDEKYVHRGLGIQRNARSPPHWSTVK